MSRWVVAFIAVTALHWLAALWIEHHREIAQPAPPTHIPVQIALLKPQRIDRSTAPAAANAQQHAPSAVAPKPHEARPHTLTAIAHEPHPAVPAQAAQPAKPASTPAQP
ncbi:MAG TPA: DUF3108 domain-containing protein, partial [Paraburkholderia sp.]